MKKRLKVGSRDLYIPILHIILTELATTKAH